MAVGFQPPIKARLAIPFETIEIITDRVNSIFGLGNLAEGEVYLGDIGSGIVAELEPRNAVVVSESRHGLGRPSALPLPLWSGIGFSRTNCCWNSSK